MDSREDKARATASFLSRGLPYFSWRVRISRSFSSHSPCLPGTVAWRSVMASTATEYPRRVLIPNAQGLLTEKDPQVLWNAPDLGRFEQFLCEGRIVCCRVLLLPVAPGRSSLILPDSDGCPECPANHPQKRHLDFIFCSFAMWS